MSQLFNVHKPLFKSEFLDNALNGGKDYKSYFLGNAIDMNGYNSDLFLIIYHSGNVNAIVKYGEKDSEYSSGDTFLWQAAINQKNKALHTLYERAVQQGILVEKRAVIGYSEKKDDILFEKYISTDYYKNKPDSVRFYNELYNMDISDEEECLLVNEFEQSIKDYDSAYESKYGTIPMENNYDGFHLFDSLEEAVSLCSDGNGIYEIVSYTTKEHLQAIGREKNYLSKMLTIALEKKKKS